MKIFDMRLKVYSTITIVGPTQSGKTTLTHNIVKNSDKIFNHPFSQILWYTAYPPTNPLDNVLYIRGEPNDINERAKENSLIIIDDYMDELKNSVVLTNLMTKGVHHRKLTVIYLTQNLFHSGKHNKTRRLNTSYMILFKSPQDLSSIDYLSRQLFPDAKHFLTQVYQHTTSSTPYSYLLLDLHAETPNHLRLRTNILPTQTPMIVFTSSTHTMEYL